MVAIRAIYRDGQLQPLDPIDLTDGQVVKIQILDERGHILEALSDVVVRVQHSIDEPNFDEDALQREIDEATKGITLSDLIIEERRSGR